MSQHIQPITLDGRTVAIAVADELIISQDAPADELPVIEIMGLYALRVQAGEIPGPYTDQEAMRATLRLLEGRQDPRDGRSRSPITTVSRQKRRGHCHGA